MIGSHYIFFPKPLVLCTSNSPLEVSKIFSFLMFGNAKSLLGTSTFPSIVCLYDSCLKMIFHQTLQNDKFLIVTFLIYLFAIIILYRKITTHTLDQESMSYGRLGFNPFPKNFIFPFCEEWELEITAWVLGLLIDPDFSLFLGLFSKLNQSVHGFKTKEINF